MERLQPDQTRAAAFCKPAHGRGSSMCAWAPVPEHVKMLCVTGHSLVLYKYLSRWNGLCGTSSSVMGMECGETETLTGRLVVLPDNLRASGYLPKSSLRQQPQANPLPRLCTRVKTHCLPLQCHSANSSTRGRYLGVEIRCCRRMKVDEVISSPILPPKV